jgi:hypothetical protein
MLADAEARLARRAARAAARKRRVRLLIPCMAVILWALADLIAARHARLGAQDVGVLAHVFNHFLPVTWTLLFVFAPMGAALKIDPLPAGALLAIAAGPFMTPRLFGAGGWHPWQTFVIVAVTFLVFAARRART